MPDRPPHPSNVPGDFYVEDGCCTLCGVPFVEAPELFGTVGDATGASHCYVRRQPETHAEVEQMVGAITRAEFECIRYRGTDGLVQLRLVAAGAGAACDTPTPHLAREAEREE